MSSEVRGPSKTKIPTIKITTPQAEDGMNSKVAPERQTAAAAVGAVQPAKARKRVVVAMTGATGAILGIRLLEKLRRLDVETHLVMSKWAEATIAFETDYKIRDVRALASKVYSARDVAAPISSGSFKVDAMMVVPCSMKTLSSIATGYGDDLISRAADVTLKERRRLILMARETPLSGIHLENMMKVTQNGAIIFPPVPAFYIRPKTVDDIIDQSVGRLLDLMNIDTADFERWDGMRKFGAREG
ncbi:3-octaprenyl-4-hydroxybenzoate carboxy-lyase UbiX [Cladophialophora psammophila CBS 110553]|uniref:Flavin prenyltransferase PAD1, mitochondrial n=1 Tax=Cladophialophora psammophila CBS 110553 TaxID=1182543 RepID=W9WW00_9EURO|nr:3-octaprenyl-4-hydroxybenzoate carboxy-lyase UbiX [Cladophialophora psammophila CBS 110553]EXJ72347.1 3-octaprenyl-4-hydroxybenzoate carboxy-lyase UbiX [Cladophialophora psammophila CBS 110553]